MKQSSLLLRGMSIILFTVLFVSAAMLYSNVEYTDPSFAAKWFPYEMFLAVAVVLLWYFLLKKDIPLNLSLNFNKTFFVTLPLFLIPLSILIWVLLTSQTLDSTKMTMFFATAFFVGIAEEIAFRVAGYRVLVATGSSVKKAILISALFFSLFHLVNIIGGVGIEAIAQLINTFMIGVILAYIYYKTESILYVMLLHFMWDLSNFAANAFSGTVGTILIPVALIYFIWAIINVVKLKEVKIN